ncbi:MAG: serine/threonine-protein kinase [Planctomycetota bacterium]
MSNDRDETVEGLPAQGLLRAALGPSDADDPEAARRAAEEEARVRAAIERRLPDLELRELLGRGGMGFVYRALQRSLDREVALKVMAAEPERHADFAERFAREARTLARLSHPNLVAVYDHGQDGALAWLVMEYVDGSNLRDVLRAGELAPAEALALVPKLCDALQFAHDHGVVHRDVKPENILLDGAGNVKIADFGLAKLVGSPAAVVGLTGSQQVLGTFRYMAPEQLDRPREVDHRADIYSLGVVLYEMLTGEVPMGRFEPPSQRSAAPLALDGVVLRALEREPERRYQSASEVKSDLESAGDAPDAVSTPERSVSWLAVGSVAMLALACVPTFPLLLLLLNQDASGAMPRASRAALVVVFAAVLMFGLYGLASALGFAALHELERRWPELFGVRAAIVGAWMPALLAVDAVLAALTVATVRRLGGEPALPAFVAIALLAGANVALLGLLYRRFVTRAESSAAT